MEVLAVGVPRPGSMAGGWDWWPLLAILAIAVVLLRRNDLRIGTRLLLAAVVGGCLFGFAVDGLGLVPALAIASALWVLSVFRHPGTRRPGAPGGV
jgi:hypothetical protein